LRAGRVLGVISLGRGEGEGKEKKRNKGRVDVRVTGVAVAFFRKAGLGASADFISPSSFSP